VSDAAFSRETVRAHGVTQLLRLRDRIQSGRQIRSEIEAELLQTTDLASRQEILTLLRDIRTNQLDLIRQAKATIRRVAVFSSQCECGGDHDLHREATGEDEAEGTRGGGA